ncbi:MAG: MBL fold metallo-hydrolase [Alphaproteobacteria bacterium]|nr:MAG: MBL fold metallo-hydrolase [Alphaproteobacteria bacterium]
MKTKGQDAFAVTFWGVRGTLASPGCEFQRVGGNTICAELRCGDRVIVFDAGTGIRGLGSRLIEQERVRRIDLMLTHVHYDHVEGIPFFAPFFAPDFTIDVWLGRLDGAASTEDAVKGLMRRPYFPVGPDVFRADVTYRQVAPGQSFDLGDGISVKTAPLNHPGGATGYRVDYRGRSFAFVTDTEHVPGQPDQSVLELIEGVDLFAYDASLTDAELPEFTGYGHSTWEEGARLREAARAGAFLTIHHMPFRTDDELDEIEAAIRKLHAPSGVAREGMCVELATFADSAPPRARAAGSGS